MLVGLVGRTWPFLPAASAAPLIELRSGQVDDQSFSSTLVSNEMAMHEGIRACPIIG